MAATATISIDDVRQAIAGLRERRLNPSVRAIRRALGHRGSNELILRLRAEILGVPEAADDAKPPSHFLMRVQDVAPDLWKAAVTDARAAVATDLQRLDAQLRESLQHAEESAQMVADATQRVGQEQAERERLASVVAESTRAMHQQLDRQTAVEQGLVRHGDAIADLRSTVTGEGEAARSMIITAQGRWAAEASAWAQRTAEDHRRIADLQAELVRAQAESAAQRRAAAAAAERESQIRVEHAESVQAQRRAEDALKSATTELVHTKQSINALNDRILSMQQQLVRSHELEHAHAAQAQQLTQALATAQAALVAATDEQRAQEQTQMLDAVRVAHAGVDRTLVQVLERLTALSLPPPPSR